MAYQISNIENFSNWTDSVKEGTSSARDYETSSKINALNLELVNAIEAEKEEGISSIQLKTVTEAQALIQDLLPFELPLISCLPDGGILFQWTKRPDSIFTFSVHGEGLISYAGTFREDGERIRGTLPIKEFALPKRILEFLNQYFPSSNLKWIPTSKTLNQ